MAKKIPTVVKVLAVVAVGGGVYFFATRAKAEPKKKKKKLPVIPPQVNKPPKGGLKKPPGHPSPQGKSCYPPAFGGTNNYDNSFWDAGGTATARARIFDMFTALGYQTPADRDTMNALGPDDALGGGDDVPNIEVTKFQKDYNAVSRWKNYISGMGGLDADGLVGPCTLNGMKLVYDALGDQVWSNVVAEAKKK